MFKYFGLKGCLMIFDCIQRIFSLLFLCDDSISKLHIRSFLCIEQGNQSEKNTYDFVFLFIFILSYLTNKESLIAHH
jgi:hypothetical protein